MVSPLADVRNTRVHYHPGFSNGESMKKTPYEVVTEELGVRPLARALQVHKSTVCRWRHAKQGIPKLYFNRIMRLADGRISLEDLVYGRED